MFGHMQAYGPVTLYPVVFYVWSKRVLSSATYTIHTPHLTLSGDLPLCVWIMLIKLAMCLSLSTVKFRFVRRFVRFPHLVSFEIRGFFNLHNRQQIWICSLNGCLRFRPLFLLPWLSSVIINNHVVYMYMHGANTRAYTRRLCFIAVNRLLI